MENYFNLHTYEYKALLEEMLPYIILFEAFLVWRKY